MPDEKAPENLSDKEMEQVLEKEGERILSKIKDGDVVVAMAIEGDFSEFRTTRKRDGYLRASWEELNGLCHRRLSLVESGRENVPTARSHLAVLRCRIN